MRLLLDTSVLIDVLRGRQGRRQQLAELARAGHTLTTTALNVAEVYSWMRPHEKKETDAFLDALECYQLTVVDAKLAGSLKRYWSAKGRTLALADTIIAAIAIERECALLTDNRKDFPMPEVQLFPLRTS